MKIGLFLPNATFDLPGSPEVGGIETFAFTVGEALQHLGHDVILFGGQPKGGRRHRPTSLTLELHPYWPTAAIPDLGTRFRRLVQRLHFARSIRPAWIARHCDVVLLAKPFDWPIAWNWKKARPELKVVMGFHGTDFYPGDRLFYGAIDAAFAVSAPVADLAERRVGRRPVLIPNPVDADFFSPGVNTTGARGDWHLVSSGRIVGWKGFSHLVEAVIRLRQQHGLSVRLTLAGDGPERPSLERRIARAGLAGSIRLAGLLAPPDLRDLLRAGDLYVLPSIGLEAFSIGALEAASVGLPLALSSQVGLAGYLTPADVATWPAGDVGALVALLQKLHARRDDPAWSDRAARHERLRGQFSPARVAGQILDLIR
jgi:glycosyltransferase involved in cell wall biosynthesis